jgi:hypothetical protein
MLSRRCLGVGGRVTVGHCSPCIWIDELNIRRIGITAACQILTTGVLALARLSTG